MRAIFTRTRDTSKDYRYTGKESIPRLANLFRIVYNRILECDF